jgi:hypothetical protein
MPSSSFRVGFKGNTLDEIVPWAVAQVGDTDRVVVAMAGSGKDIANLAREGRTIRSWDPQEISRCVVQGVFAAPKELPDPLSPAFVKGYATTYRTPKGAQLISGMPTDAARLMDYIAQVGSDYDRACLSWAITRATFQGRLKVWSQTATVDTLYSGYLRAHAKLAPWRGLPGTFVHTKGSVFEDLWLADDLRGAVLFIDTPKVINDKASKVKKDIYSTGFVGLNSILAQADQLLPTWTVDTFRRDMPLLWQGEWTRMLMFHATGCLPSVDETRELMTTAGVPDATPMVWGHGERQDVCWVVDR